MSEQDQAMPVESGLTAVESSELVRSLGLVLSNTFLYGPNHGVTKQTLKDSFGMVTTALAKSPEISINISEDVLMVNNAAVEVKNPLVRMFMTHFSGLQIGSFSLTKGMTSEDFEKLMFIMNSKPEDVKAAGGFAAMAAGKGLQNVKTRAVTYVAVTENEVVVDKDAMSKAGSDAANVESVLAFLNGGAEGNPDAIKGLAAAATDAAKLGDLILKSVDVRKEPIDVEGGETLASLVVGSLRRAFVGLAEDPQAKTQKGKKNLQKMLVVMEKDLLDKLRTMGVEINEADQKVLSDTIEELSDDLKIDALAEEYMKKRNAIEANESRILRFIKAKGLDKLEGSDLKDKLMESGLTVDGWRELLAKSGLSRSGTAAGSAASGVFDAVGHLAMLLGEMQNSVKEAGKGSAEQSLQGLGTILETVHKEVAGLVVETEKKILGLIDDVRTDEENDKKGPRPESERRISRKKLLEILAEIAQELCQPLAVINCSVDMMKAGGIGPVTTEQVEMLNLASESGTRLHILINKLMELSGVPHDRLPDEDVLQSIYK